MNEMTTAAAAVKDSAGAAAERAQSFFADHPVMTVLIVVGVLLLLLLIWRLIRAYINHRRNSREVSSLKQDLMIWNVLSSLVQGGRKTDKAKAELNRRLAAVTALFTHGLNESRRHNFFSFRRPWYVLLGEPNCGKSALLLHGGINFKCSAAEKENAGEQEKIPLRFFYTQNTVILDVGGRVFFDNWLGGSSAEWAHICTLIRKKNHARPLDGIIVTISAEALLGDDHSLTVRKAGLIADELKRLTGTLRMFLPCYILVTKLDTVVGFREYFAQADEKTRNQILGMRPRGNRGAFDADDFEAFFEQLCAKIEDGAAGLMQSRAVLDLSHSDKTRLELSGPVFLFAGNFRRLKENLATYLEIIFEPGIGVSRLPAGFSGLYFTSALDMGYCLSERFAQLQHKSIDDAPLTDSNFSRSRSYFIVNLLRKIILPHHDAARFTRAEQLKRKIPFMAAALMLAGMTAIFWYGIIFSGSDLQASLRTDTGYFQNLTRLLRQGVIANSPMISVDYNGSGVQTNDDPMPHDPSISRINFFNDANKKLSRDLLIPWSFFPASALKYSLTDTRLTAARNFIADQLQFYMAFRPLVESVELSFLNTPGTNFSVKRRDALFSLMEINLFAQQNRSSAANAVYTPDTMQSMLLYLFPGSDENTFRQMTRFLPEYDFMAKANNDAIILGHSYRPSCRKVILELVDGWKNLSNYPEMAYSSMRQQIDAARIMLSAFGQISRYAEMDLNSLSEADLHRLVTAYRQQASTFIKQEVAVNNLMKFGAVSLNSTAGRNKSGTGRNSKSTDESTDNQFVSGFLSAYRGYSAQLNRDFDALERYNQLRNAAKLTDHNIHFGDLDFRQFASVRSQAITKLTREFEDLRGVLVSMPSSQLFLRKDKDSQESGTGDFVFNVYADLLERSLLSELSFDIASPADIQKAALQIKNNFTHQLNRFSEVAEATKNSAVIQPWLPLFKNLLNAQYALQALELLHATMKIYPEDQSELNILSAMTTRIGQQPFDFGSDGHQFSIELAEDVLGPLNLRHEYNPKTFLEYLYPVTMLNKLLTDHAQEKNSGSAEAGSDKQGKEPPNQYISAVQADPHLKKLIGVMRTYAGNFINYWGNFADSIHPSAKTFTDFYLLAEETEAYQVNAQLQNLYDLTYSIVSKVDDSILGENAANAKKNLMTRLQQRINAFSIDFTDQCAAVMNAWSMLGPDATYANQMVMQMDDKSLKSSLLTLGSGGKDGSGLVPWWKEFTKLGSKLLKRDASADARLSLQQYQSALKHFPVVSDGDPNKGAYSREDLKNLLVLFRSFGLTEATQDDSGRSGGELKGFTTTGNLLQSDVDLHAPLTFSTDSVAQSTFKTWSNQVEKVLKILTAEKPVTFSLGRVDPGIQAKLYQEHGHHEDQALGRYRYFDVVAGDGSRSRKYSTFASPSPDKPDKVLTAAVDASPLVLNFYKFSDSTEPDASVTIGGAYPSLQMYLSAGADASILEKQTVIPVIADEKGNQSVLFFSLTFNTDLPTKEDWPATSAWPKLRDFDVYKVPGSRSAYYGRQK